MLHILCQSRRTHRGNYCHDTLLRATDAGATSVPMLPVRSSRCSSSNLEQLACLAQCNLRRGDSIVFCLCHARCQVCRSSHSCRCRCEQDIPMATETTDEWPTSPETGR